MKCGIEACSGICYTKEREKANENGCESDEEYEEKTPAMRREWEIKQLSRNEKEKIINEQKTNLRK